MIRLLLAMLTARRGAALTVFALATVAAAAAATGPLYQAAATSAAATAQIDAADPAERAIRQTSGVHREAATNRVLDDLSPKLPYVPDFDTVSGLQVEGGAQAVGEPALLFAGLVYRSGACRHLVAVTGRCVSGANEVMVSTRAVAELGLAVGDPLLFAGRGSLGTTTEPVRLTVVGSYQPRDAHEAYWAGRVFGTGGEPAEGREAIFATWETVAVPPFQDTVVAVDLIAHRAAFDDPAALRATVAETVQKSALGQVSVASDIPRLLDRIAAGRGALTDGMRLAGVPLVLLCWFVLHLATANSAFRQRAEFGLAGLRGVPRLTRWWLSTAEYAVPLLLGGGVGYLGAYLAGVLLGGRVLPGNPPVQLGATSAWYVLGAVGGALAVGVFTQWRSTALPVATLLRRVPVRRLATRLGAVEVVAVALAVAAGYQVRTDGDRAGLALLTPVLVALAVGLVAARLVGLVADRAGRRALRRGALGRALAGLHLARQPGQARLLGVLVTLFAILGFAVTAVDVGATARAARVRAELGAARVLAVEPVPNRQLLAAVRAADPDGRYAMAVARMPGNAFPILAVDPQRLARVANWEAGYGPSPEQVARLLQPQPPGPVRVTGDEIEVRATVREVPERTILIAWMVPARGATIRVDLGELRPGTTVYRGDSEGCATGGCRLLGLEQLTLRGQPGGIVTFHQLRQYGPEQVVVDQADLATAGRWVVSGEDDQLQTTATPVADGIEVRSSSRAEGAMLRPAGAPVPLPVVTTDAVPATIPGSDPPIPVTRVAALHIVPGLGGRGGLISLEYADLVSIAPNTARASQVWLTEDAPADLPDRLREAGLVMGADRTAKAERAELDQRGPALALRFYLLVALAVVALGVGAVAVVAVADRRGQTGQLRALRAQGVPPAIAWRVGFGGYAWLTGAALVLGTLAAALAWWLARGVIPFFVDDGGDRYPPAVPHPVVAVAALAGATVVLLGAGAVAGAALRRAVEGRQS